MIFPALTAVKANNAAPHEQGAVQGAIFGARSVALGVGPLFFAMLFALFTRPPERHSRLPFLPQAPFIAAMGLIALGLLLALSLPRSSSATGAVPVLPEAEVGGAQHADGRGEGQHREGDPAGAGSGDDGGGGGAGGGAGTSAGAGVGRSGRSSRNFWERAGGTNGKAPDELRAPLLRTSIEEEKEDEEEDGEACADAANAAAGAAAAARRAAAGAGHGLLEGDVEAGDGRHLLKPE